MRNTRLLPPMSFMPACAPVMNTMPQAITSTKIVRMAVARLELMPWTPILPRIAVRLANNAESPA